MKKFIKVIAILSAAALLAVSLSACSATTGKLSKIQKNGTIVVYTDPNFYPFEFPGPDGIDGVDIQIGREIAADLGVTLTIQEANFDAIIMSLKGGKGDIAISGMTITDERKESIDFSIPYINSIQYIILREDSDIKIMEDLAGKKIGVAMGYTGSFIIDDELNEDGSLYGTGASSTPYPSAMEASLDLLNGKVEAVIMDEYVAKNIVAKNAGLKTFELANADGVVSAEEYGVVVPKGNKDLLDRINGVLTQINAQNKVEQWVLEFSE